MQVWIFFFFIESFNRSDILKGLLVIGNPRVVA